MGTRFMLTQEAPIHDAIKQAVVQGSERNTTLIFRIALRNTARVFRNAVSDEVNVREREPDASFETIKVLVAGARGRVALETGDVDGGLVPRKWHRPDGRYPDLRRTNRADRQGMPRSTRPRQCAHPREG